MTMKREDYIELEDYLRACHVESVVPPREILASLVGRDTYYAKLMLGIHGDGSDEGDH